MKATVSSSVPKQTGGAKAQLPEMKCLAGKQEDVHKHTHARNTLMLLCVNSRTGRGGVIKLPSKYRDYKEVI